MSFSSRVMGPAIRVIRRPINIKEKLASRFMRGMAEFPSRYSESAPRGDDGHEIGHADQAVPVGITRALARRGAGPGDRSETERSQEGEHVPASRRSDPVGVHR